MTTDDAKPIIRTLRDALMEARAYVYQRHETFSAALLEAPTAIAAELLETIDGALAEADEVLS